MDEAGWSPATEPRALAETTRPAPAGRAGSGIAIAVLIIMASNVLSRVLGLGRDQLATGLFGTGDHIAAFTIADNHPDSPLFLTRWSAAPDAATRRELHRISRSRHDLRAVPRRRSGLVLPTPVARAIPSVRTLPAVTGSRHIARELMVVALPVLTGAAIYLTLITRTSSREMELLKAAFGQKLARLRG